MGDGAPQRLHVQHAGELEVVDVVALATDEACVLNPLATGTETADLYFV